MKLRIATKSQEIATKTVRIAISYYTKKDVYCNDFSTHLIPLDCKLFGDVV